MRIGYIGDYGAPTARATIGMMRHRTTRILLALGAVVAVVAVVVAGLLMSAPVADAGPAQPTLMDRLERRASAADGSMDVQAILGTLAYFRSTGQPQLIERYGAERDVVVILSQDIHFGGLPARPRPTLAVDGRTYTPSRTTVLVEGDHHRSTLLMYADAERALAGATALELRAAGIPAALTWERPYAAASDASGPPIALLLALFGGMLASMWPCLFQLTAYFLPSVAGLSIEQARTGRADRAVLRTAILFVSGVVLVYTLAGFAAGVAAQSVSGTAFFESARQPLTLVAGIVIIAMAVRLALSARRPLVCHMPATSASPRSGLGIVVLGLAFATGCMTCFGAAVVLGMFTYVVTTASPLVGAAILFVFSLGIAVPLVIAAIAMARVLPLIARLERAAPALTLASATIMAGYGVLLVTGTSHLMSDLVARVARIV